MPILCIIFVIWLAFEIKKSTRDSKESSHKFWAKEHDAFLTPRKPIDDVVFLTIPEDIIPAPVTEFPETLDTTEGRELMAEANSLINELKTLASQQMADLSEYTNTDLRLKYGAPNFTILSNADTAYAGLVQLMPKLIKTLKDLNRAEEARVLLDFCKSNHITSSLIKALDD